MNRIKGRFIPVNEMPNYDELLGTLTPGDDMSVRESRMVDVAANPAEKPGTPDQTRFDTFRYNMEREVDFVWGFLFFDFPTVYVDGNNLHFQGEIHKESVNMIKQYLLGMLKDVQASYNSLNIYDMNKMEINMYINSPGGCMSSGFDLIDFMDTYPIGINTIGTGSVASMAVLLLCAGKKRSITKNSHLLVHQFRTQIGGKRQDILDYLVHLENIHRQMVEFLSSKTKMSKDELNNMLKNESWVTAAQAKDLGIVDNII